MRYIYIYINLIIFILFTDKIKGIIRPLVQWRAPTIHFTPRDENIFE